jgi:SOS-response transcriptional repressor LexA
MVLTSQQLKDARLTPVQARGLETIERLAKKGYPPRLCEIQAEMGYASVSGVQNILRHLKAAGYIAWEPKKARSIRILGSDSKILEFDISQYGDCSSIQIRILKAIVVLTNQHQRPPSTRELLVQAEIRGTQTLLDELVKLRGKGAVTWVPGVARTLRVRSRPDRSKQS